MLPVLHMLGRILVVFAGLYVLPLAWSLLTHDGAWAAFLQAAVVSAGSGLILVLDDRIRNAGL